MRDMKIFTIFLFVIFLSICFILSNCTVKDPIGPFLSGSNNVEDTENEINDDTNGDTNGNGSSTNDGGIDYIIQHDWETNEEGWIINWGTAITNIEQSTTRAKSNNGSLAIIVNLNSTNTEGEATYFFNPSTTNLSKNKIHLWVFFPNGSQGDPGSPNTIQLIFRDSIWNSKYSHLMDLNNHISRNVWNEIIIDMQNEAWNYDDGCNLDELCGYGIKISRGPASTYSGSFTFYIDAYGWD